MNNILVTGGAGFIGSNYIHSLLRVNSSVQIINFDVLTYAGCLENLNTISDPARYHFVQGDICDQDKIRQVLRKYEIDTIVHFAAETHVDRSITGPSRFIQTNVMGTFNLLEEARQFWIVDGFGKGEKVRFHHISTDEVFGSLPPDAPAFNESTPYDPRSPYSASKAASDHLVRAYYHTYQLPITVTNCSNNYGPYQFPEKLIPLVILNASKGGSLPIYGDGKQIRDWLYVEDHCEAIHRVIERGQVGETYAVGGNNQPTNLEIVREICTILDQLRPSSPFVPHASLIRHVPDRPGHDRRYAVDIRKIEDHLGWHPKETLRSGLLKTAIWYLENQEWIKTVTTRPEYQAWLIKNYKNRGDK